MAPNFPTKRNRNIFSIRSKNVGHPGVTKQIESPSTVVSKEHKTFLIKHFLFNTRATMECLMGLACQDFVMLAADMTKTQSILVMKSDEEKMFHLTDKMLMAVCGDSGDTSQFSEFIAKNIQLYKMRNGYSLSPSAASSFTRRNLADYLRSQTPYNVNLLIGGYDDSKDEFELYFCDYLASLIKVPYAVHGFGGHFCLSIMDRLHRNDLTIAEGYDIVTKCVREIHKRVVINLPNFKVQIVTREGIKTLEPITSAKLAKDEDM